MGQGNFYSGYQPSNHNYGGEDKMLQKQMQINQQLLKQKISQEYTTDMLGRALSKAEFLSSRFGKSNLVNKQFNYYNRFDNGMEKDKDNLTKSFINDFRYITGLL